MTIDEMDIERQRNWHRFNAYDCAIYLREYLTTKRVPIDCKVDGIKPVDLLDEIVEYLQFIDRYLAGRDSDNEQQEIELLSQQCEFDKMCGIDVRK